MSEHVTELSGLLDILRCPATGQRLSIDGEALVCEDGAHRYPIKNGVPDLFLPPKELRLDLPWLEPWDEIDAEAFRFPDPLEASDLPWHLDKYQASIPGSEGRGRAILEVGCGQRLAEPYFTKRGFRYVGTDVDHRGVGPHAFVDGHNLAFADEVFDLVYSMSVYEHLMCPLLAARETLRVLKPGGKVFGSAAFMLGYHDRASFNHMSHAGLIWLFRTVGFEDVHIWPGWEYSSSVIQWAFPGKFGTPWRVLNQNVVRLSDRTYTRLFNVARRLTGRQPMDLMRRRSGIAGGLNFVATKAQG